MITSSLLNIALASRQSSFEVQDDIYLSTLMLAFMSNKGSNTCKEGGEPAKLKFPKENQ